MTLTRNFGYLDIWIFGFLDIWIFGYLDLGNFGYLELWIFEYLDIWIMVTTDLLLHPHSEILSVAALLGAFFPRKTRPWCFAT